MAATISSLIPAPAMLEALIAASKQHPRDMLIQEILEDLRQLNDKVILLRVYLGREEALHKQD